MSKPRQTGDVSTEAVQTGGGRANQEEIAYLAYMAWKRDGCPCGRDVEYWLEVEQQLKATRQLLQEDAESGRVSIPLMARGRKFGTRANAGLTLTRIVASPF